MSGDGFGHVIKHEIYAAAGYRDEDLVALARVGDASSMDAVEALLRRYDHAIYRACLSYLRNVDRAEEASQEILLRVYRGIGRFQGRSSFRTWLYSIIRNECYSLAAYHKRHQVCDSFEETEHTHDSVSTQDVAYGVELHDTVHTVLQQLSMNDRQVIRLRFFSDLSLAGIAEQLGTSLSGAKMRLYRAIARFEKVYRELEPDTGVPTFV